MKEKSESEVAQSSLTLSDQLQLIVVVLDKGRREKIRAFVVV